jgi:hypothetical protein
MYRADTQGQRYPPINTFRRQRADRRADQPGFWLWHEKQLGTHWRRGRRRRVGRSDRCSDCWRLSPYETPPPEEAKAVRFHTPSPTM